MLEAEEAIGVKDNFLCNGNVVERYEKRLLIVAFDDHGRVAGFLVGGFVSDRHPAGQARSTSAWHPAIAGQGRCKTGETTLKASAAHRMRLASRRVARHHAA